MYPAVTKSALFRLLESNPGYHANALSLRSRVDQYLRAVTGTYAHYTSHAVDHSDQIVFEVSSLLFEDPSDPSTATIDLNEVECYLFILAAYLHDSGMVVTESEKLDALGTVEWTEFAANHPEFGAASVSVDQPLTGDQAEFLDGLRQRWALAEFFRGKHASRSAGAITGALKVSDYLEGDVAALRSLTAICVGHGLSQRDLGSDEAYPTRRDHFNHPVDVRLLAILLRLGDLLDMRYSRACPLLLNLASPLPDTSEVHWKQYGRIVSRVTSPRQIQIEALCESADEHRLLLDWCQWLADEVRDAPMLLSSSSRHRSWAPPMAQIGEHGSIRIDRAPGAKYRVGDWRFKFDESAVISRLVSDIHGTGLGFVRELVQNSLDAIRTRIYAEHDVQTEFPPSIDAAIRANYPLKIRLGLDEPSGVDAKVTEIEVADSGVGMNEEVILDYFLQIGRSWYATRTFRERFRFAPTSRFGIGFLSVFAVSSDVTVVTRHFQATADQATAMRLYGPRGYLITEEADRDEPGTSVIVRLETPIALSVMTDYLRDLLIAVEVPVRIERGDLEPWNAASQLDEPAVPDIVLKDGTLVRTLRLPSTTSGVFGFFDVTVFEEGGAEDWSLGLWELSANVESRDPLVEVDDLQRPSAVSLNGLRVRESGAGDSHRALVRYVLDIRARDAALEAGLEREFMEVGSLSSFDALKDCLNGHVAGRSNDRDYLAKVLERFETLVPAWTSEVPYLELHDGSIVSNSAVKRQSNVWVCFPTRREFSVDQLEQAFDSFVKNESWTEPTIPVASRRRMTSGAERSLFARRWEKVLDISPDLVLLRLGDLRMASWGTPHIAEFEKDSDIVAIEYGFGEEFALNAEHPLGAAVLSIDESQEVAKKRLVRAVQEAIGSDLKKLSSTLGEYSGALGLEALGAYGDILRRQAEGTVSDPSKDNYVATLRAPRI